MKKKILKFIVTGCIITTLAAQSMTAFAYTKIYQNTTGQQPYADGVTHENLQIFTNEGWINMNILRVDLRKNADLTVVTDTVLTKRDTLTNLVKKNNTDNTIVAAINSDFFDTANNTTMGNLIKDGQVLSTSVGYAEFASFNVSKRGVPFIEYLNSPNNTFSNGVTTKKITYVNKPYLNYNRTIYFDKNFATQSYGKTLGQDILEVIVENNVITEMRRSGEPYVFKENSYVLASIGTEIADVLKNFKVGDAVEIKMDVNFRAMDLIVGGGAQLVKEGKVVSTFSQNITGLHPRTGLGITKDRKNIILVTIDGRTSSYRGVSQTELANILIGLGAYEAINLDGGGSTQMVAKSPWSSQISTLNFPSDSSERKMYTGLAVQKVLVENPVLNALKINLSSDRMLLGSEMKISLQGTDTNYNPVTIDASKITWSVTGVKGVFEKGVFIPQSAGNGVITAAYEGLSATQNITVKNNGVRLVASPTTLKVDENQEKVITFSVITEEGETIPVSSKVVKAIVPTTLGTFNTEKGAFVAGSKVGQGYISCEFDGLTTYIPVGVGVDKQVYYDFEKPTATFAGYPATVTGGYEETTINAKAGKSGKLSYDFSKSTDTRAAYMNLTQPATLPFDTQAIGMWVFGDEGKDHWLRARVTDSKGTQSNISFTTHVDWTGWKYVTADLPTDLVAPFKLDRIYLVETDATKLDSGYILVDQIEAITSAAVSVSVPAEVNRIKKATDYKLPSDLASKTSQLMGVSYIDKSTDALTSAMKNTGLTFINASSSYNTTDRSDALVIKMNNKNGTIRKNDYTQWTNLLNVVKNYASAKPVIFVMSDVYSFNDKLEQELFLDQLQALDDKGVDVAVVFPTANKTFSVGKDSGASIIKVPKSADALTYLKLGVSKNIIYFEAK